MLRWPDASMRACSRYANSSCTTGAPLRAVPASSDPAMAVPATRNTSPRVKSARSRAESGSATRQPRGGAQPADRRLGSAFAGLVVLRVPVHLPDVVQLAAGENVLDGEHRRHHRVVLVVVLVHAVAAGDVQVGKAGAQLGAHHVHVL